jgi:hypothetical protein
MPALVAVHDRDPREEIQDRVGDLDWFELRVNQILCAVYERPEKAKFGSLELTLTDKTRQEDRYQGKVGLVLKMGPMAFEDDAKNKFLPNDKLKIGDWVVYRASDGWQITLTGDGSEGSRQLCRVFVETDIRAVIPSPDMVW